MKISIVTINFNNRGGLRRTLSSLRGQTDRDFESIVIDGGSTDGSQLEQRDFSDVVSTFVSEKDGGIHDAWNKGIARCSGDLIALLNSGDCYTPDVIETARARTADWGQTARILCGFTATVVHGQLLKSYTNRLRTNLFAGIGIVHPATFMTREVYRRIGTYHPIRIASDTDFILRCIRGAVEFVPADFLVLMEAGGVSARLRATAFRQYTEALVRHRFCNPLTGRLLASAYGVYRNVLRRSSV